MYLQINCIQSNTMRQTEKLCLVSDFVVKRRNKYVIVDLL